jgi:hypothetical protein
LESPASGTLQQTTAAHAGTAASVQHVSRNLRRLHHQAQLLVQCGNEQHTADSTVSTSSTVVGDAVVEVCCTVPIASRCRQFSESHDTASSAARTNSRVAHNMHHVKQALQPAHSPFQVCAHLR